MGEIILNSVSYTPFVMGGNGDNNSNNALCETTIGYTCKNLLPYPYVNTTTEVTGVTYTDNGDGTITANGTNTGEATAYFTCATRFYNNYFLPAGKYILSGCPANGDILTYGIQMGRSNADGEWESIVSDFGDTAEFEITEENASLPLAVQLRVYIGATVDNITFKPMIRRAEIQDDTYESYKQNVDTRLSMVETSITGMNEMTSGTATINSEKVSTGTVTWYKYGNLVMVSGHVTISSVIAWSDVTTPILSDLPPAIAGVNVPFGKLYATMGSNGILSNNSLNDMTAERHGISFVYIAK